jgi:hypothetical protein
MDALHQFMSKYKAQPGDITTHASLPPKPGKWSIPSDNIVYTEFLQKYSDAILAGVCLHLTELHAVHGPIVIDLDFKYDESHGLERKYTQDTIKSIVQYYNDQITLHFDVSHESIIACVMEKDMPTLDNGVVKDGFHIVYPYIVCKPDVHYVIRENVIQNVINNNTFSTIPHKNTVEDILDEAVIKRSGWMMYHSQKAQQRPYLLTYMYDNNVSALC